MTFFSKASPWGGAGVRFQKGDSLHVAVYSSLVSAIGAYGMLLLDDGTEQFITIPETATNGLRSAQDFNSRDRAREAGFVSWMTVYSASGVRGQIYALVAMAPAGGYLAKGYVTPGHPLSMGEFVEAGPHGGHGYRHTIIGGDPAANAECSDAVPTNTIWRVEAYQVELVCDANVATRVPYLLASRGTRKRLTAHRINAGFTAGVTKTAMWSRGNATLGTVAVTLTDTETALVQDSLIWNLCLVAGDVLRTQTDLLQVGDNYGAPDIDVEDWVVP